MLTREELIINFSQKAEGNQAAFFIGAGISVPYGLPDFYDLIKTLASGKIDLEIKKEHNFPEIAQYIMNSQINGRIDINDEIKNKFDIVYDKNKSGYLDAIAKSTITTIWTTNYDTLIEQSFSKCNKRVVVKKEDVDFQREFENLGDIEILKIHGDINSKDIIITKNDYEDFNISRKATIRRLEKDFLTKSILFIGYSYKDPNIQAIVNNVRQLTDGKLLNKHYMILDEEKEENDRKLQQLWIEDLERYGIQVYVLKDGFKELENILKKISLMSKGKTLFITGSHYDKNNKVAEGLGKALYELDGIILNYGASEGIGKTVCNHYARECVSNKVTLEDRICVYPNPYSFCEEWDNEDFLLDELKILRTILINKTQIIVAFPGGKGTISEIDIGLEQGAIVIPVFFDSKANFKSEVLKRKEILDTLNWIDKDYVQKLMDGKIELDDIIGCIKRILI